MSFNSTLAAESEFGRGHIVDALIDERAVNLMKHPIVWRVVKKCAKAVLAYKRAVQVSDTIKPMSGRDVFELLSQMLQLQVEFDGIEHIPRSGRAIITPNHPAGIADGIALWDMLRGVRDDVIFLANRDCIRVCKRLAEHVIPVEWREGHRSKSRTRETSSALIQAVRDERLVVIFPSGRLARPTMTGLEEHEWHPTAVSAAQKYDAPLYPMYIKARNTFAFYLMWLINNEIKDMMLFRELLNKRGQKYRITLGERFPVDGEIRDVTARLRGFVVDQLRHGITRPK